MSKKRRHTLWSYWRPYDRTRRVLDRAEFIRDGVGKRRMRAVVTMSELDRMAIRQAHDSVPPLLRSPYLCALHKLAMETER